MQFIEITLYWIHTSAWVFSCEFAVYFQNTFSLEHLWVAASAQCSHSFYKNTNKCTHALYTNCYIVWNGLFIEAANGDLLKLSQIQRKTAESESLFSKVAGHRPTALLKQTQTRIFSVNSAKFLKIPVLQKTYGWLFFFSSQNSKPSIFLRNNHQF